MSSRKILFAILTYLVLLALQIFFLRHVSFFGYGFSFAYIGCIILLPLEMNALLAMLLAFGTGLTVDMFYDTAGMNAAASLIVALLRPTLIKWLTPAGGYEGYMLVSIPSMGPRWYVLLLAPLLLAHHFVLFFIDYASATYLLQISIKTLLSAVFTFFTIIFVQYALRSPQSQL